MTWEEWLDVKDKIIKLADTRKRGHLMLYQDEIRFTVCETTVIGVDICGSVWAYYGGGTCTSEIKIAIKRTPEQIFRIVEDLL